MEYMMTYGTPTVNRALRFIFLELAAKAGRADIVRYVYEFKRDEVPWNFTGKSCESMEHTALYYAQNTASLEVLRFVAELRGLYPNTTISRDRAEYWLAACIEWAGWTRSNTPSSLAHIREAFVTWVILVTIVHFAKLACEDIQLSSSTCSHTVQVRSKRSRWPQNGAALSSFKDCWRLEYHPRMPYVGPQRVDISMWFA
jgi:hypothetical protein